jgi:uncharacterized protein (TIGR00369 family)
MSIPSPVPGPAAPKLEAGRIAELVDIRFPQIHSGGRSMLIEQVGHRSARVRMVSDPRHMRPGGTVSGPAMFALTDFSVYVAIITSLGEPGFDWVTSSLNINFLARPAPADMMAVVRLIRLGRRSAVGEVELYSEGIADMVAHAIANYALPSREAGETMRS